MPVPFWEFVLVTAVLVVCTVLNFARGDWLVGAMGLVGLLSLGVMVGRR